MIFFVFLRLKSLDIQHFYLDNIDNEYFDAYKELGMKIYRDTVFYICCPPNYASGGPELLQQLASYLISRGVKTYMYYGIIPDGYNPVHENYRHYHIPYTLDIQDSDTNVIIVYETATYILYELQLKTIRKIIWWLSVDNFYISICSRYNQIMQDALKNRFIKYYSFDQDMGVVHWVQSEYARQFLEFNGVQSKDIKIVSDYINLVFLDELVASKSRYHEEKAVDKEDIVLYNPNKGMEFTRQLISAAQDIKWVPIINMTRVQVYDALLKGKVYIDFGNHPGKDRIPREAAAAGCVVITGKRGSAANEIDVPIPNNYKFDDDVNKIEEIIERIRYVFENYESCFNEFGSYVESIFGEPLKFRSEVDSALDLSDIIPVQTACVMDDSNDSLVQLIYRLYQDKTYKVEYAINESLNGKTINYKEWNICFIDKGYARQLYLEGRITKFICSQEIKNNQDYYQDLINRIDIADEDWDIVKT